MATGPATIDLGVLDRGDDGRPEPWTVTWRRWAGRVRRRRRSARRGVPVLLAVMACLPLGGGAPAPPPRLTPLWTEATLSLSGADQWSRPVLGDAHLYALAPTPAGAELSAYRLRDGRTAWRRALGARDPVTGLVVVAGVPVVVTDGPHVTAYHPGTGRRLWRRPGVPRQEVAGLLLVAADAAAGGGEVVTALDPRTGEVAGAVVERADRVAAPWQAPDGSLYLFTLRRDGALARLPMTGDAAAARVGTPHREQPGDSREESLAVLDDLVVVAERTGEQRALTAYDAATLRRRWTVVGGYQAIGCEPVVCVRVAGGPGPYGAVYGVDPLTGVTRWSRSCADAGYSGLPCTMLVRGVDPGRLWAELAVPDRYTHGSRVTSWVLDATTGEPVSGRARWGLQERYGGGSELLVSRSDRDRAPGRTVRPARLWWGRTGPAGGVEVLGSIDATVCLPRHPYLVCGTGTAGVTVWRIDGR